MHDNLTIENILGEHGLLAESLAGFEYRASQINMARVIKKALDTKNTAVVEAGTGTGKTFGYLVPIVLSGKKAVISTGTKNLQDQVFYKDLPLLIKTTGLDIDAMMMKGRKNYLCLHKYHQYFAQGSLFKTGLEKTKNLLEDWLTKTEFADRSELPWLTDDENLWEALTSGSDQCLGPECFFYEDCFLNRLRNKAAKSRIIIVNHHLFFADLKIKKGGFGEIIPRFQVLVFDEAHNIEEIATSYLGDSITSTQLIELAGDIDKTMTSMKDLCNGKLEQNLVNLRAATERLKDFFGTRDDKGIIGNDVLMEINDGPAREIRNCLRFISEESGLEKIDKPETSALVMRTLDLETLLEEILRKKGDRWLNWYEKRKKTLTLNASPLDISGSIREHVFDKLQSVIFTSATLSTNGDFNYFQSRLGLNSDVILEISPSLFDYGSQTLMYIPKDLPEPGSYDFGQKIAMRILEIIKRTNGRALVLFTSYHNLNLVSDMLQDKIPYLVLKQGDAPRTILLNEFKKDIHSVLFATGSFWQGVDVPGEALSCLIIDKLPFDSPGEPLVGARIDSIRQNGGNPFVEYQIPSAIIALKQGLGRLIRKNSDRGILSVLDIRLIKNRYGKIFLNSLPDIPVTHNLSDIDTFMNTQ